MKNIQEVFGDLQNKKRELKELQKNVRDTLASTPEYEDIKSQLQKLKERKKVIENSTVESLAPGMDNLKLEVRQFSEMLSDIAMINLMKGETVSIDYDNAKYEPVISVRFKKGK